MKPISESVGSPRHQELQLGAGRFLAVDLLRGLTIGFMIIVNNKGDGAASYWAFKHSTWNGATPTDLVFPTFLFLVGLSIVFSLSSRLSKGATRKSLFLHTLRRSAVLFLIGVFVNSFPHFHMHTLRLYGVLPRIAVCYFVVATLYLFSTKWPNKAVLLVVLLIGYWVAMRFVYVPGYGLPGRDVPFLDRDGNLAAWIDRQTFSASHLYQRTRDPEGLLSTLPSLATTLFGSLTGQWMRTNRSLNQKSIGVMCAGAVSLSLGLLWNVSFPINKNLWTSSFVLYSAGWSLLLLSFFLWLVDFNDRRTDRVANSAEPLRRFTALLVFGMNAIAAYIFAELLEAIITAVHLKSGQSIQQTIYQAVHHFVTDGAWASFLYSLAFVATCWIPMYWLYRKRVFIKI